MAIDKLLNFQIVECLYSNNSLSVFRAKEAQQDNTQVLKVLNKVNADIDEIEQLRNEYQILQQISELDGVPKVADLVEDDKQLILVLSDIHGITLHQASKQSLLSTAQVVDVLKQTTVI